MRTRRLSECLATVTFPTINGGTDASKQNENDGSGNRNAGDGIGRRDLLKLTGADFQSACDGRSRVPYDRPWRGAADVNVVVPTLVLDGRNWTIGIYCDDDLAGIDVGPMTCTWLWDDKRFAPLCRSWRIARWVIRSLKLDIRLEIDLNNWRIGYVLAAPWDHGLYLGPVNLQIEYTVMYDEDY